MSAPLPAGLLPPQVHVFVRDWLSSNNVLLKSRDGHVLIDSGYGRHAPLTLALLATGRGLADAPLSFLVNTHCHADHVGGNAAIVRRYDCPVAIPEAATRGATPPKTPGNVQVELDDLNLKLSLMIEIGRASCRERVYVLV